MRVCVCVYVARYLILLYIGTVVEYSLYLLVILGIIVIVFFQNGALAEFGLRFGLDFESKNPISHADRI